MVSRPAVDLRILPSLATIPGRVNVAVLSALGLGVDFRPGDVVGQFARLIARATLRTVVQDAYQRKGRALCDLLSAVDIPGVEVSVMAKMEYRAGVVFRGEGPAMAWETDPQGTGIPPAAVARNRIPAHGEVANEFLAQTREILAD